MTPAAITTALERFASEQLTSAANFEMGAGVEESRSLHFAALKMRGYAAECRNDAAVAIAAINQINQVNPEDPDRQLGEALIAAATNRTTHVNPEEKPK